MDSIIQDVFQTFAEYIKFDKFIKDGDQCIIKFEYITFDNIDQELDLDEDQYARMLEKIDTHFKIYSRESLLLNQNLILVFESSYKKIIFKVEDNMFSHTIIDKNKLSV